MKECCIKGVKHEGEPKGSIKEIGGIKSYVAEASTSNGKAILYIADAFGMQFINNKLVADDFAAQGYTTVIPDIFRGEPVPPNAFSTGTFDLPAWLAKHPKDVVEDILDKTIAGIKSEFGIQKVGAVGYCFGGKYVIRFLGAGKIDAGFAAHPSFAEDDEFAAVKGPLSLACAEIDQIFPAENRHSAETKLKETKLPYQITLYGGTQHGFAVRCDLSDPRQKFAKEAAFHQAIVWFEEHL